MFPTFRLARSEGKAMRSPSGVQTGLEFGAAAKVRREVVSRSYWYTQPSAVPAFTPNRLMARRRPSDEKRRSRYLPGVLRKGGVFPSAAIQNMAESGSELRPGM